MDEAVVCAHPEPWNKGKLVGQKAPFKLKEIWAIRIRLQLFRRARDLALFDLGASFLIYVEHFPAPTLRRGDVVVMDNLASHKVAGVKETIEGASLPASLQPRPQSNRTSLRQAQSSPSQGCRPNI